MYGRSTCILFGKGKYFYQPISVTQILSIYCSLWILTFSSYSIKMLPCYECRIYKVACQTLQNLSPSCSILLAENWLNTGVFFFFNFMTCLHISSVHLWKCNVMYSWEINDETSKMVSLTVLLAEMLFKLLGANF